MSSSWGKKRRTHHDKRCGNVTKRCVVDLSIANWQMIITHSKLWRFTSFTSFHSYHHLPRPLQILATMIRTPSIHSQNDPITEALKPPPSETEAERIARLAAEDEARRISEKIDDDLREEREHLRRKKGDVKVGIWLAFFSGAFTHCLSSYCFSVRLKAANQHFKSNFSSCIGPALLIASAYHGRQLSISTSFTPLNIYWPHSNNGMMSLAKMTIASPSARIGCSLLLLLRFCMPEVAPKAHPVRLQAFRLLTTFRHGPIIPAPIKSLHCAESSPPLSRQTLNWRIAWAAGSMFLDLEKAASMCEVVGKLEQLRMLWVGSANALKTGRRLPTVKLFRTCLSLMLRGCSCCLNLISRSCGTIPPWKEWLPNVGWSLMSGRNCMLFLHPSCALVESSRSFLKHITRVASPDYVPSTGESKRQNCKCIYRPPFIDDILHARIQTMGVAEHIFDVTIHGKSVSWHLFDVGGARGQRHSWVPYFDDANAIIFVAPVSAFDQVHSWSPSLPHPGSPACHSI